MDDRVTELLRRTLAARAADIGEEDRPFVAHPTSVEVGAPSARGGRWGWWAAAAAAAIVLVGATVVVVGRSGSDGSGRIGPAPAEPPSLPVEPVAPTDPTAPGTTVVPTPDEDGLADSPDVASNATGWFLPTYIPDGVVPISTSAMRLDAPPGTGYVTNTAWIRRTGDGHLARLWITAFPSHFGPTASDTESTDDTATTTIVSNLSDAWATVHGVPASVQDDEYGRYVSWPEAGLWVSVRSEVTLEETVSIAEQTVVDASGVTFVSPPAGFEQPDPAHAEPPPDGAIETSVWWAAAPDDSQRVGFDATPNTYGQSVDTLVTLGTTERIDIGGEPAIVDRRTYDPDQTVVDDAPLHESHISWFVNGFVLSVSGPTSIEPELVAMARSVRPASEDAFHAIDAEATELLLQMPPVDEAVFADGLHVSFRAGDGPPTMGGSRSVLCAGTVRRHCGQGGGGGGGSISAGDAGDIDATTFEYDHYHALFSVDGRRELIVWVRGVDLEPQVTSITPTSMDPLPFEGVHTADGLFIRIPAESSIAEVRVTTANGSAGTSISYQVFDPDVG